MKPRKGDTWTYKGDDSPALILEVGNFVVYNHKELNKVLHIVNFMEAFREPPLSDPRPGAKLVRTQRPNDGYLTVLLVSNGYVTLSSSDGPVYSYLTMVELDSLWTHFRPMEEDV